MFLLSTYCVAYQYLNLYLQFHETYFSTESDLGQRELSAYQSLSPFDFAYSTISPIEVGPDLGYKAVPLTITPN